MVVITIAPKSEDIGNAENGSGGGCNGDEGVGSGMIVTNGDPKSPSVVTTSERDTVTVTAGNPRWVDYVEC